jgi:hypothetical protein
MAITTSTLVALAAAAAAAGISHQNTVNTANRADQIAAQGIRDQSKAQQKADVKVNEAVDELAGSTAADERAQRLSEYATTLRNAKANTEGGLDESQGGSQFAKDAAAAKQDLAAFGADRAGKLATVDAAGLQRMGEGFSFGNLASDIGLVGRESQGIDFLTRLKAGANRRNAGMDALSSFLGGVASGGIGGAGAAGTGAGLSSAASGAAGIGAGAYGNISGGLLAAMRGRGG